MAADYETLTEILARLRQQAGPQIDEAFAPDQPREIPTYEEGPVERPVRTGVSILADILGGYAHLRTGRGFRSATAALAEQRRGNRLAGEENVRRRAEAEREASREKSRFMLREGLSREERAEQERKRRAEEKREEDAAEERFYRQGEIAREIPDSDVMPLADLKRAVHAESARRRQVAEQRAEEDQRLQREAAARAVAAERRAETRLDRGDKQTRDIEAERRKAKREVQRAVKGTAAAIQAVTPDNKLVVMTGNKDNPSVTVSVAEMLADLEDTIPIDMDEKDAAELREFMRTTVIQAFARLKSAEIQKTAPQKGAREKPKSGFDVEGRGFGEVPR